MILLGLDTDDSKQLEQLKQKIRSMDTDGARSLQTEISRQGGAKTDSEISVADELRERRRQLGRPQKTATRSAQELGQPAVSPGAEAADPVQPQPATNDTWAGLGTFAETLERRGAEQQPHSVRDHLRQRLGDAQRGKRPNAKARNLRTGQAQDVTENNYRSLLDADEQQVWRPLDDAGIEKLKSLLKVLQPKVSGGHRQLLHEPLTLFNKAQLAIKEDDPGRGKLSLENYKKTFQDAWREITEDVEKEVLDLIGIPEHVYICSPNDDKLDEILPAFYDAGERSIYISGSKVTVAQIKHEFGHHIEEQGPVEIWRGLASLLQSKADGKVLLRAQARQVIYDIGDDREIPRAGYTASYYADAGTELLAISLEDQILRDIQSYTDVGGELPYSPDLLALLLHALRPQEMREAGFPNPALLGS